MAQNYSVTFREIQQALDLIDDNQFSNITKIKKSLIFDGFNLSNPKKNESGVYSTTIWRNADEEKMISIALTLLFISSRDLYSDKPSNLTNLSRIRIPNDDIQEFPLTKRIYNFISNIEYKESSYKDSILNSLHITKNNSSFVAFILVKCPTENFHIDHGCKRIGVLSVNGHGTMVLNDKDSENVLQSCINFHDRKHIDNNTNYFSYSEYDYFGKDIGKRIKDKLNHNDLLDKSVEIRQGNLAVWNGIETPNPKVHSSPKCIFQDTPSEDTNILPSFISFLKNNPSITSKNTLLLNLSKLKPEFVSQIESSRKLVSTLQTNIVDTHYAS